MSTRSACVLRVVSALVVIELVLVLTPSPEIATAGDKNRDLTQASMNGDVEKVISLLGSGADINVKDQRGWTPLLWAVSRGQMDLVKLLLDKGAVVNPKHEYGWTALKIAKAKGNKEIVGLLKAHGAKE